MASLRPTTTSWSTGRTNPRQTATGNALQVSETHVFPRFDPGTGYGDAALLVLSSPTPAPAIPLAGAADSALYDGGAGVLLAGWGLTRPNARSAPNNLHSTSNVVLNPTSCKSRTRDFYPPFSVSGADVHDRSAGPRERRLLRRQRRPGDRAARPTAQPVEIGVVSTGGPQCSTKLPNIFTRIDLVSTWASEWIATVEAGAPPPALKARLPRLTEESAEGFVVGLLRASLGNLFVQQPAACGEAACGSDR